MSGNKIIYQDYETTIIELTIGNFCIYDTIDHELLKKYTWHTQQDLNTYYARTHIINKNGRDSTICMHSVIIGETGSMLIDHINRRGWDNSRRNLRVCNQIDNMKNRVKNKNNKSGYKGVRYHKATKKWHAEIGFDNAKKYLGLFNNPIDAAIAYNNAAIKYHGDFAILNDIPRIKSE
jgi:hypothetical protein